MELSVAPEPPVAWQGLLGYLNLSAGKPDPRFQGQLHAACCLAEVAGAGDPCAALAQLLQRELSELHRSGAAAFRDIAQARAVIATALLEVPKAYLSFHADLFCHCRPSDILTPFFLARVFEAVLAARAQDGPEDLTSAAVERLNDFVGYRPTPVLETRRAADVYEHERFRPSPIYLRGVGVAAGRFQTLLLQALTILASADADLLDEAQFDLHLLDEFALDPRPYDHNHPANRRPNHVFGEWDPHHLDALGRYRRFVARQSTLDAMLARVDAAPDGERNERLFEASAVLAGTMLMASSLCGRSPHVHDSGVTLGTLVPRIARLRDAFYDRLIASIPGPRGDRLRAEAQQLRQPFGGARRDLNLRIAQERARQLQEHHLALLYASLGCPNASRDRADRIATASVRLGAQARCAITLAGWQAARGEIDAAAMNLREAEALIRRGIECGALADPWSMLAFQGLYPLFAAREDSIYDLRVEELLGLVGDLFAAHGQALAECAARGREELRGRLQADMERLAGWWDQFAGYEIQDLPRVHGGESTAAAGHVADALARWRDREAAGQPPDLAFWRAHLEGFRTPAAFARVVAALLDCGDLRAAMGLLMAWLSEAPRIALEDHDDSFHDLAQRWMTEVGQRPPDERTALVRKFLELIEANAEANWDIALDLVPPRGNGEAAGESRYESAYEGVTYRDSADDGTEGALLGDSASGDHFGLEGRDRELQARFQFLTTVAELWRLGSAHLADDRETLRRWRDEARRRRDQFAAALDQLQATPVPEPTGGMEATMEYDRRRVIKDRLIEEALAAALATARALRAIESRLPAQRRADGSWHDDAVALERALHAGQPEAIRRRLLALLNGFREVPLLYVPLSAGGLPDQILRARIAQGVIVQLLEQLPRFGRLRESYFVMQTARQMEKNGPGGRRVTEFDRMFPVAVRATVDAVLDLGERDPRFGEDERGEALRRLVKPYVDLWIEHSDSIRLSVLESVDSAVKWERIRGFVQRFGRELFTASFLQLANLRAILHRGVETWLDELGRQDEAPESFLAALEADVPREQAVDLLTTVIQALVENYDEFRDYNATTTQSDYGENLHVLLDFLRAKAGYERDHWRLRPLVIVHEVLIRRGHTADAEDWRRSIAEYACEQADRRLAELSRLEEQHGLRLRTIRDRLEERFIAPLTVDRLAALMEPAWSAARQGAGEDDAAIAAFRDAVNDHAETPQGVGLDVPPWIERLEEDLAGLRRRGRPAPRQPSSLTLEQLRDQLLHDWSLPLELN